MKPPRQPAAEAQQQSPTRPPASPPEACVTDLDRAATEPELRMRALEQEVNALCLRHGEAARYPLAYGDDATRSSQAMAMHQAEMHSAEMHANDASHRMLFDAMDEGFCIIEKLDSKAGQPIDFRYIEANPAFVARCDASGAGGVVGKTIRQLFPGISEAWLLIYDKVLSTGESIRFERQLAPNQRALQLYVFQVEAETRRRLGIIVKDVTERAQALKTLRRSESELRDFVENASLGLQWIGPDGTVLWANQTESELLGYTRDEYVGRHVAGLYVDQPVIEDILARLKGGETLFDYAARLRHKDGSVRHVLINSNVLVEDGQFIHTRCFTRDVTDHKRAQDTLQQSEAFSRSIIQSSPDCIKVLDLQGNLLSLLSGQKLLGIEDIHPLLNKPWIDFWAGGDQSAAQLAIDAAAAGGKGSFVGFFRTPAGEAQWWDVAISPIFDLQGQPSQLLAISREVTQRRRAQLNLEFLDLVSRDLVHWNNVDEMMRTVGVKVAAHLELSLCAFVDVDETAERVVINHDWHRDDVPGLVGVHRLGDFVGESFIQTARAGEAIVVSDVATDPRTDPDQFAALKIASFICMPLIRDGQWRFALCLYKSGAHDWREDEIALTRELTTRIWTRLERLRAEAALRQSEERFRALVMASSDVIYRMSPDWREMRQLHGQNFLVDTTAPNDNWLQEYIHPDDQPRVLAVIDEAIRTKGLFEMEHQVVTADGSLGWTSSHAIPLLDADGEIVEWFGTASDVTQQKQAEQALRESEERYRNLFNSMDEGYCIIEMIFDVNDKPVDYRYLEINPSFEALTGMDGALGKRILEFFPDIEEHWLETYGKVALTGEAVRVADEVKPMNRWFDLYAVRFGGAGSRKVAIFFNNITEQKKTEQALLKSEARFRALFDWEPIGMYACDSAGVIQEYNRGAVRLWGREPSPGETDEKFRGSFKTYLPDGTFVPFATSAMTKILKGKAAAMHDMEIVMERLDGSRINLVVNVVPMMDGQGQITGAITCFYDITERTLLQRKTLEQAGALADLDRRKDEFLAMLSHELRNPLAAILNAVHLLRLQKSEDPLQKQARSIIERQVGQLKHLVDDLLEVSRISTGRVQLRQAQIMLGDIARRAVETAQPLITQHRHELTVSVPPEPILLRADAARLEQVLVNLLTNAAKYTEDGGRIALTIGREGDTAVLRVRDSGIGIAPELLPHIFDLFTQADRSLDRSQGGLGIGLCLVQRLVELHGGSVAVTSVLGQGSEFVVYLPVAVGSLPVAAPLSIAPLQPREKSCRVLVVDDNVDAAQTVAMLLDMSGHQCRMAHDGPGGLEAALAWQPDAVLLDIGLPGLNGYELARLIRHEPRLKNVVLVALTGYGLEADRQRSREAGFDHHLVKPADFDEIEKILESISQDGGRREAAAVPTI